MTIIHVTDKYEGILTYIEENYPQEIVLGVGSTGMVPVLTVMIPVLTGMIPVLTSTGEVAPGNPSERVCCYGDHIFVGPNWNRYITKTENHAKFEFREVENLPIQMQAVGNAYTKTELKSTSGGYWPRTQVTEEVVIRESPYAAADDLHNPPKVFLTVQCTAEGVEPVSFETFFTQPRVGTATLDPNGSGTVTVQANFFGMTRKWTENLVSEQTTRTSGYVGFTTDPFGTLNTHIKGSICPDGVDAWWDRLIALNPTLCDLGSEKGLTQAAKKAAKSLEKLKTDSPREYFFFQWLRDSRTQDKKCNNNLLSCMLTEIGQDYAKLQAALEEARKVAFLQISVSRGYRQEPEDWWFDARRTLCLTLPGARDRVETLEAKAKP